MTKQEIFDKAVIGLAGQNWRRAVFGGACRYRAKYELRCAIGHVIPDEQYRRSFEGKAIQLIMDKIPILADQDETFMHHLQNCHDLDGDEWLMKGRLLELASIYSLEIPEELK